MAIIPNTGDQTHSMPAYRHLGRHKYPTCTRKVTFRFGAVSPPVVSSSWVHYEWLIAHPLQTAKDHIRVSSSSGSVPSLSLSYDPEPAQ